MISRYSLLNQGIGSFDLTNSTDDTDFTSIRRSATIWNTTSARQAELISLVTLSGCIFVERLPDHPVDFLLIDLCSETEQPSDHLTEIVRYLETCRSTALVWTDMDGLEEAYNALPTGRCHFLIESGDVEAMTILVGANGRSVMGALHDRNHGVEFGPLHRISDELAEFARTLARMADNDDRLGVSDKSVSFLPAPQGSFQPFGEVERTLAKAPIDAKSVRSIIKARRLRESFFNAELFADPAWDILLDLMAARLEGRNVSVSSLCIAAAVPPTTALRWITAMTESGMLLRQQDPHDARRVFIVLSEEVTVKLNAYFAAADQQNAQSVR